jgi:hypothetical protein
VGYEQADRYSREERETALAIAALCSKGLAALKDE